MSDISAITFDLSTTASDLTDTGKSLLQMADSTRSAKTQNALQQAESNLYQAGVLIEEAIAVLNKIDE